MTTDAQVSEQTHQYFLQEAAELLQTMDDELQNLREDFSVQKVHNLMRAAHTLKGASASVGLDSVKKTTHSLEDVFKALCHQDTILSAEMEELIFQGYDCLKLLMSAQLAGAKVDEADILDRMATVVTQLQAMLGDRFGQGGHLPTSSELGFDMTQSIFEVGVAQRIDALSAALEDPDPEELIELLQTQGEVFIGLAESLDLPGFGEIAQTTQSAIERNPDRVLEIAPVALENYRAAHAAVLAGDRERGGSPSVELQQFCSDRQTSAVKSQAVQSTNLTSDSSPRNDQLRRDSRSDARKSGEAGWFKRMWATLTHSIGSTEGSTAKAKGGDAKAIASAQTAREPDLDAVINSPLSAPDNFIDYSAEGDEPADLALIDLVPSELSSINLVIKQVNGDSELPVVGLEQDYLDYDNTELSELAPPGLGALAIEPKDLKNLPALSAFSGQASNGPAIKQKATKSSASTASQQPLTQSSTSVRGQNSAATIRMTVEHLDQLSQAMGELLTQQNRQALYNEQLADLVQKLLHRIEQQQKQLNQYRGQNLTGKNLQRQAQPLSPTLPSRLAYAQFDSLELDEYSDVQLLAQSFLEETVQQSESAEAMDLFVRRSAQALEKQKRLLANTRETLLSARMLPLEKVFQRFPPALSRLRAQHNKQVDLVLEGEDVLVDKVIADKLYDPLLHLVRNAFDHGIESPEIRRNQKKAAVGKITIEALQQGRHLVINVRDDGQGLNLEVIRRKAVENQIITEVEAAELTPEQTVDLLFEAGFSTASEVNDLSGRGVGLDAVRAQVRSLQGWVAVSYEPGVGTCFTLQIPSSLTIAKLLLCQAQGRIYALIADAIEHILIPTSEQVRAWEGGKTLLWQASGEEHLVPVNALAEVLHYASPMPNHRLIETQGDIKATTSNPVILLHHQDALVGIEVDQLLGEQELVISSLGETVVPPAYLYGSSILPDGQLTLVLDGVMLAQIVLEQRNQGSIDISVESSSERLIPPQNQQSFTKKLILTVDDSITVRNALSEALQKADYQVVQARDGAEALQQLQRYSNIKAILCDIEMPGMNGFEFLKARQQDPAIAAIPTIMLTSRAGTKHRLLTEELGATTYLTKPYLTPQLLETVANAIKNQINKPLNVVGGSHE
ncbi:MAG: hybrid sensor histidine kinase/response regulator [Phormidesmis sp.]